MKSLSYLSLYVAFYCLCILMSDLIRMLSGILNYTTAFLREILSLLMGSFNCSTRLFSFSINFPGLPERFLGGKAELLKVERKL